MVAPTGIESDTVSKPEATDPDCGQRFKRKPVFEVALSCRQLVTVCGQLWAANGPGYGLVQGTGDSGGAVAEAPVAYGGEL